MATSSVLIPLNDIVREAEVMMEYFEMKGNSAAVKLAFGIRQSALEARNAFIKETK